MKHFEEIQIIREKYIIYVTQQHLIHSIKYITSSNTFFKHLYLPLNIEQKLTLFEL